MAWKENIGKLKEQTSLLKQQLAELRIALYLINDDVADQRHKLEKVGVALRESLEHRDGEALQSILQLPSVLPILNNPTIGAVVVGPDGRYRLINEMAKEIIDSSVLSSSEPNNPQGYGLYLVDKLTQCEGDKLPWQRCLKGAGPHEMVLFVRSRGVSDGIWIRTISMPIMDSSKVGEGAVAFIVDATAQINVEEQIKVLIGTLEQQLTAMEVANGMLVRLSTKLSNQVVAALAHEEVRELPELPEPLPVTSILKKVLIADDIPVNQKLLSFQLRRLGIQVDVASNGKEAFDAVVAQDYDMVFMDLDMAVMDGSAASQAIRDHESRTSKHVPIVAMTAYKRDSDCERCLNSGMDYYLVKGVSQTVLRDEIAKILTDPDSEAVPETIESEAEKKSVQFRLCTELTSEDTALDLDSLYNLHDKMEMKEVSRMFCASGKTFVDCIQLAIDERNGEAVSHFAHCIQGPSSSMGLNQLTSILSDMISTAETEDWTHLNFQYVKLKSNFSQVIQRLMEMFELEPTSQASF